MRTIDQDTVNLPVWALPYVVNADPSGLEEGEKRMVNRWWRSLQRPGLIVEVVPTNASFFSHRPAFGLACEVVEATITWLENGS